MAQPQPFNTASGVPGRMQYPGQTPGMVTLPNGQAVPIDVAKKMVEAMVQQQQGLAAPGMMNAQQQAAIRESLENPHAQDDFSSAIMPAGPEGMLIGGAAGIGVGTALNKVFASPEGGASMVVRTARWLDKLPVISHISNFIENNVTNRLRSGSNRWGQQLVTHMEPALVEKMHLEKLVNVRMSKLPADVFNQLLSAGSVRKMEEILPELIKNTPTRATKQVLNEVLRSSRSLENGFFNLYREQHALYKALGPEVGPIGRFFANSANYLKRIMGGHTMNMGAKKTGEAAAKEGGSLFGKLFGPFLAGGIIFGMALGEAKKADEGDKVKSFFHNLFGTGLGQFIGWEVGKRFMRPLMNTIAPSFSGKLLLGRLARFVPLLGRVTWGGFIAEMTAMFILSIPFQKAGEWLANTIFGKPKHIHREDLKKQGIVQAKALPVSVDPSQRTLNRGQTTFQGFAQQRQSLANQPSSNQPGRQEGSHPLPPKAKAHPKPVAEEMEAPEEPPFSLSLEEISRNKAGEEAESIGAQVEDALGTKKGKIHNIFDPQFPVPGGGGH